MERIKKFMLDESGTAEATSTVIMVAAVGILLGAALLTYYTSINNFFGSAGAAADGYAGRIGPAF